MESLYKAFYKNNSSEFNELYEKRSSFESTVHFGLTIKPINQPHVYELYYVPTNQLINKTAHTYKLASRLNLKFENLPAVAKKQFILEQMVEEQYATNDIEGVKSTKAEIARSVRNINTKNQVEDRFHSMTKSYYQLINGDILLPKEPEHICQIYNDVIGEEIAKDDLLDGKWFRKDWVYVLKKSGSQKVIHRGITPEKNIIDKIEKLLVFINDSNHIPALVKIAVGHYYFGYIHPFYDGNGRTSRLISSMYLYEELGLIPAISFSQACSSFQSDYLNSFEQANSLMNRGEMNHFIDTIISIIYDTLEKIAIELAEKYELLKLAHEKIEDEEKLDHCHGRAEELLFILAQYHFFEFSKGLTIKELSYELALSEATVRKIVKQLLEQSLIEQYDIRPAYFTIAEHYFEQ